MGTRVLVVDDESLMSAMISAILDVEGFEVRDAADGHSAWALLPGFAPDVILSDLAMPVMDGFELLRRVRRDIRYHDIPFVILTAHNEPANRIEAMELGANAFIPKPFDTDELVRTVETLAATARGNRSHAGETPSDKPGARPPS